jgi:hypothetical protein
MNNKDELIVQDLNNLEKEKVIINLGFEIKGFVLVSGEQYIIIWNELSVYKYNFDSQQSEKIF